MDDLHKNSLGRVNAFGRSRGRLYPLSVLHQGGLNRLNRIPLYSVQLYICTAASLLSPMADLHGNSLVRVNAFGRSRGRFYPLSVLHHGGLNRLVFHCIVYNYTYVQQQSCWVLWMICLGILLAGSMFSLLCSSRHFYIFLNESKSHHPPILLYIHYYYSYQTC